MLSIVAVVMVAAGFAAGDEIGLNAAWAERAFSDNADRLSPGRVAVLYEDSVGETKFGVNSVGKPLRLGEKTHAHGIGVNAHSVLRVLLPGPGRVFRAEAGLDRNVDNSPASVRFRVEVGGHALFETDVIRPGGAPVPVEAPLGGATVFDLIVDNGGDTRAFDQADWADARVLLEDGTEVYLDDLSRDGDPAVAWPFSFV
ncbi:MAG TPA: NPCBM/NEW2 domain-containing protein, partial [Candidatus Hydrogenedentes bacterium]|nr:NPCBM/NEW2 domain-containing protein [Candidatus Hydrogenedentota bacterium]